MAFEMRGFPRGRSVYGRCCNQTAPAVQWCSDCDVGVEAQFVPCCCEQEQVSANGDPCGCTPDRRD